MANAEQQLLASAQNVAYAVSKDWYKQTDRWFDFGFPEGPFGQVEVIEGGRVVAEVESFDDVRPFLETLVYGGTDV